MRRLWVAILVLFSGCLASCLPIPSVGRSILQGRTNPGDAPKEPDVVFMDIATLEVPVGDRYINEELWTETDEQILPAATRLRLEHNGLRVGLVVNGRIPDQLQRLLTTRRSNPDPRQVQRQVHRHGGNPHAIPLAADIPVCEFPLEIDERSEPKKFEQVKCLIQVVPNLEPDSKVRIAFTPQIEYSDGAKWSRLNPNFALAVQGARSTASFPELGWDVTLGLNDYVVVGTRFNMPKSLGFWFFVTPDLDRPIQRLVAIRAGRFKAAGKNAAAQNNAPLASQAVAK